MATAADPENLLLDDVGLLESEESIVKCAHLLIEQAKRILDSTDGWADETTVQVDGVKFESKAVTGATKAHRKKAIPVVRAEGRVECKASELYKFFITADGFALIDPLSDSSKFDKPFAGPYSFGSEEVPQSVHMECATLKISHLVPRQCVVVDVKDGANLALIASSALHNAYPGGTPYQSFAPVVNNWRNVRYAISAAYSCKPVPGEEETACTLRCYQRVDICGWIPASFSRTGNLERFAEFYKRVQEHVDKDKH